MIRNGISTLLIYAIHFLIKPVCLWYLVHVAIYMKSMLNVGSCYQAQPLGQLNSVVGLSSLIFAIRMPIKCHQSIFQSALSAYQVITSPFRSDECYVGPCGVLYRCRYYKVISSPSNYVFHQYILSPSIM